MDRTFEQLLEQIRSKKPLAEISTEMISRDGESPLCIAAWEGDAQELIFEDNRFHGAYLTVTLGEVPDQDAALRELARVVKPGGRVVVGEMVFDPHMVTLGSLRERAGRAGLVYERKLGTPLAYFARFRVPDAAR